MIDASVKSENIGQKHGFSVGSSTLDLGRHKGESEGQREGFEAQ